MFIKLEIIFAVISFFVIFIIFGFVWAYKTEKRLKRFFLGKKAKDLEENLFLLQNEIIKLKKGEEEIGKHISVLYEKSRKSIRGLETLRFNPFPDQGSNQSFAIGMLDEENNGVVISSLYSRERMSVFAKPIKGGKSDYELSEEEKEIIERAKFIK